jgi:hypothetical protein
VAVVKRGAIVALVAGLLLCAPAMAGLRSLADQPRLGLKEARVKAAQQMRDDWMPYLGAGHVKVDKCRRIDREHVTCRGRVRAERGTCAFTVAVREVPDGYTFQLHDLRCR